MFSLYNIFLYKKEKVYNYNDLEKVDIVLKGTVRRQHDSTRYYIRLKFKNEKSFTFGESLTFRKISDKVN